MKRKLKWIAVVLAVLLLGFGTALFLWPRDRITAESWKQIRIGMTEKEVEEILGGPAISPEEYKVRTQALAKIGRLPNVSLWREGLGKPDKNWIGRRGGFMQIGFDRRGHVCWKNYCEWQSLAPTFLGRLGEWLGW